MAATNAGLWQRLSNHAKEAWDLSLYIIVYNDV
jgi:hypothetical protein